jgi:hypothetical protein
LQDCKNEWCPWISLPVLCVSSRCLHSNAAFVWGSTSNTSLRNLRCEIFFWLNQFAGVYVHISYQLSVIGAEGLACLEINIVIWVRRHFARPTSKPRIRAYRSINFQFRLDLNAFCDGLYKVPGASGPMNETAPISSYVPSCATLSLADERRSCIIEEDGSFLHVWGAVRLPQYPRDSLLFEKNYCTIGTNLLNRFRIIHLP